METINYFKICQATMKLLFISTAELISQLICQLKDCKTANSIDSKVIVIYEVKTKKII